MKPVLIYAPAKRFEEEPAFRIRILALRDAMAARGYEWVIRPRPSSPWGRLKLAKSAKDFHAVILHRRMLDAYEAKTLRQALPLPGRIYMDIDDATMIHEKRLGFWARRRLDRRFAATAGVIDMACTGNDYLADIFTTRGVAATVIPSVIDIARYSIRKHEHTASPRLIWIGSSSTLKYLESAMHFLGQAAARAPGLRLTVVCDRPPAHATLPMEFRQWSLEAETQELARADIGLAPTPDDPWTRGKCGYKIVQYMAAGLPSVASPVGVNSRLLQGAGEADTCGLLPPAIEDWPAAIELLASRVDMRQIYGAAGRRRAEESLTIQAAANTWASVLER